MYIVIFFIVIFYIFIFFFNTADVLLNNPTRWRYKTGHEVDPDADWLADWDMIALASGPKQMHKGQYNDGYCVQLGKASCINYIYILSKTLTDISFFVFLYIYYNK